MQLIGIAIFGLDGLPKQIIPLSDGKYKMWWSQAAFQVLSLQSLLGGSLKLHGFDYSVVYGKQSTLIVMRMGDEYLAICSEGVHRNPVAKLKALAHLQDQTSSSHNLYHRVRP